MTTTYGLGHNTQQALYLPCPLQRMRKSREQVEESRKANGLHGRKCDMLLVYAWLQSQTRQRQPMIHGTLAVQRLQRQISDRTAREDSEDQTKVVDRHVGEMPSIVAIVKCGYQFFINLRAIDGAHEDREIFHVCLAKGRCTFPARKTSFDGASQNLFVTPDVG